MFAQHLLSCTNKLILVMRILAKRVKVFVSRNKKKILMTEINVPLTARPVNSRKKNNYKKNNYFLEILLADTFCLLNTLNLMARSEIKTLHSNECSVCFNV